MTDIYHGLRRNQKPPYYVKWTPRGSVVVCDPHEVTDEIKDEEAKALAKALNEQFETRMKQ